MIKVGCCGWSEAQAKYFQDFKVIEVQETFYQPADTKKYERWRSKAPEDFEFVLKAWQLITHAPSSPTYRRLKIDIPREKRHKYGFFQPTKEVFSAWQTMEKVASVLKAKLILFQTPASFKPTQENKQNLRDFFQSIRSKRFLFVWEARNWSEQELRELCKELNLIHCVDPFKQKPVFGSLNYFRLHGLPGYNLRYKYKDADLKKLKGMCDKKLNYVMFNNIAMLNDAKRFIKILKD